LLIVGIDGDLMTRFRKRRVVGVLSIAMAVLAAGGVVSRAAAEEDPVLGTWLLNVAKSRFNPGPPPKSVAVTFFTAGKAVHEVINVTDANGITQSGYTAHYDGQDYPLRGTAGVDSVSLRRIDSKTVQRIDKRGGQPRMTYIRRLLPDGKTMTVEQKGTDPQGRPVSNVLVFNRK
jgi:hypothetical protein